MSIRTVQMKLAAAGFNPGVIDGIWGPRTEDALDRLIQAAKRCQETLQPSQRIIEFIKDFEKCRLTAYMPTPDDVPTIGWGSTGADVRLGMTWTQTQADERFAADLAHLGHGVREALEGAAARQGQFDAMVSLAYNIGLKAFAGSTVLRRHRAGDYDGAADAFLMWVKQKGRTLNGLVRRRAAEAAIYRGDQ